jgi:uncharacterized protein YkwD
MHEPASPLVRPFSWEKIACGIFSLPRLCFRRQKARFLPPAPSRSYARAAISRTTQAALVAVAVLACVPTAVSARSNLLSAINAERADGCGGRRGVRAPLRSSRQLDSVAQRVSRGARLRDALAAAGYRATHTSLMRSSNAESDVQIARTLAQRTCQELSDPAVRDIGIARRGREVWILLAAPFATPELADEKEVTRRVLELANEARARPRRCGSKYFPAVAPLSVSPKLTRAALEHSNDMARHNEFEHEGSDGSTPAQRATRAGYTWRTVGENIAAGATSADEVMEGWLASPGHCENLMDPRFTETGIGYVVDARSESGVYWTQMFAVPRPSK